MFPGNPLFGKRPFAHRRIGLSAALITSTLLPTGPVCAKPQAERKSTPAPAAPEIAEKQADLGELRNRIEGLRKELSNKEESRSHSGNRLPQAEPPNSPPQPGAP